MACVWLAAGSSLFWGGDTIFIDKYYMVQQWVGVRWGVYSDGIMGG